MGFRNSTMGQTKDGYTSVSLMSKEDLLNLKQELGLENMTDKEILEYAIKSSQEIKLDLVKRDNRLSYSDLINSLSNADEIILNELHRLRKSRKDYGNYNDIWHKEVENI